MLLRSFTSDYSLKKRLIFFMVSIIFVPLFLLNTFFTFMYVRFYNGKIDDSIRSFQRESLSNLNYKLELYQAMLDRTTYNKDISAAIAAIDPQRLMTVYNASVVVDAQMENITFGNAMEEVHNFFIVPYDREIRAVGRYMSSMKYVENEDWVGKMSRYSKYCFIENRIGNELLSIAQVMYATDGSTGELYPVAVAKMEINLDGLLANSIRDMSAGVGIELTKDEKICYVYGNASSHSNVRTFRTENGFLDDSFKISYIFDKTPQVKSAAAMAAAFFAAGILILIILTAITVKFSDGISRRAAVILEKISRIEDGDFDVEKSLAGNDEFAGIDGRIVKMAKRLERTINENYINEAEKKRAQLLALRMQINPHFMFNTLETISALAKRAGAEEIGLISRKMAQILRYNIGVDCDTVNISEEFNHIRSYLDIQKIRYNDRFEVFYDISPKAEKCTVPKFILQPVVENIIRHAVTSEEEKYFISLSAKTEDGTLIITVNDDGDGMSEEQLGQVRDKLYSRTPGGGRGIGLRNVHLRLRITYGEEYGVFISSRERIGTSVVLKMPMIAGDGEEDGK